MSHKCNLSTSAVRENVWARKPPIQPTPITPTSTVCTGHFPRFLRAHKDHDAAGRAMLWTSPYGAAGSVLAARLFARALQTLPREARRPGRTSKERGGASVSLFATPVSPKPRNKAGNKKIKEAERRQTL